MTIENKIACSESPFPYKVTVAMYTQNSAYKTKH